MRKLTIEHIHINRNFRLIFRSLNDFNCRLNFRNFGPDTYEIYVLRLILFRFFSLPGLIKRFTSVFLPWVNLLDFFRFSLIYFVYSLTYLPLFSLQHLTTKDHITTTTSTKKSFNIIIFLHGNALINFQANFIN